MNTYDQRYDKTPDEILQEILAGIGANKDVVEKATESIQAWSSWFVEFINIIKGFFESLKGATTK